MKVDKNLSRKDLDHEKVVTLMARPMKLIIIRMGNEPYKKLYGFYSLGTMQSQHVKIDGSVLRFEFKGEKGTFQKIALHRRKLAKLVTQCRGIPGKGHFQCIGSGHVNDYLEHVAGGYFAAKDYRTWSGGAIALYPFNEAGMLSLVSEYCKKIVSVLYEVAINRSNMRTVCKEYYGHPSVIKSYEEGTIYKYIGLLDEDAHQNAAELNLAERALLDLLAHEKIAMAG